MSGLTIMAVTFLALILLVIIISFLDECTPKIQFKVLKSLIALMALLVLIQIIIK